MAKVETVTRYIYKGMEYKSLIEVQNKIHDVIGINVLDEINKKCPPMNHKDFHKMLDILCSPQVREVLMECYTVTVAFYDEYYNDEVEVINILDYKE